MKLTVEISDEMLRTAAFTAIRDAFNPKPHEGRISVMHMVREQVEAWALSDEAKEKIRAIIDDVAARVIPRTVEEVLSDLVKREARRQAKDLAKGDGTVRTLFERRADGLAGGAA